MIMLESGRELLLDAHRARRYEPPRTLDVLGRRYVRGRQNLLRRDHIPDGRRDVALEQFHAVPTGIHTRLDYVDNAARPCERIILTDGRGWPLRADCPVAQQRVHDPEWADDLSPITGRVIFAVPQ